jgi:hypothetical protein
MVGWNIDVDLATMQLVLLIEPTVVLWNSVPIASLHMGIPQQQREAVTVQAPHAQTAVLEGAIRVVSHLRQKLGRLEFFKKRIMLYDSKLSKKITREGSKYDKIGNLNFKLN